MLVYNSNVIACAHLTTPPRRGESGLITQRLPVPSVRVERRDRRPRLRSRRLGSVRAGHQGESIQLARCQRSADNKGAFDINLRWKGGRLLGADNSILQSGRILTSMSKCYFNDLFFQLVHEWLTIHKNVQFINSKGRWHENSSSSKKAEAEKSNFNFIWSERNSLTVQCLLIIWFGREEGFS